MRDPETPLELRLRAALRDEADQAGPTVSAQRLHAAAKARRRRQREWWISAAAAVGIVAVAGAVAIGSLLPRDGVANPSPSDIAGSPSAPPTSGPTTGPTPTPTANGAAAPYPIDVPLACLDVDDPSLPAIPSGVFLKTPDGDFDNHPSAPALRAAAGTTVGEVALPSSGWRLVTASTTGALYLASGGPDLEGALVYAHAALAAGSWTIDGTGSCRPELSTTRTALAAYWDTAPGTALDPATTAIPVLVTERACASAQAPGDRLGAPIVRYGDGWVAIGFEIVKLPGVQDCPGNPSVPVTVTLDGPLGDRVLLDLGQFPFAERPAPAGS